MPCGGEESESWRGGESQRKEERKKGGGESFKFPRLMGPENPPRPPKPPNLTRSTERRPPLLLAWRISQETEPASSGIPLLGVGGEGGKRKLCLSDVDALPRESESGSMGTVSGGNSSFAV